MSFDRLIGLAQRLNGSVEALAALAAGLRVRAEGLQPAPEVARLLSEIGAALDVPALDGLSNEQLAIASAMIRSFFRQAAELIEHPDRKPGWIHDDPIVLQSQGRASMMVADLVRPLVPRLQGLAQSLEQEGAVFLDIGTGVGWLAIAMARAFPRLRVVGLDIWEPALALAHANVAASGVAGRIEVRRQDARELGDVAAFDLAWLAGPFIPRSVVPAILDRVRVALRPGAWLVFGLYAAADDPLSQRLAELRIVRSGGHPWTPTEAQSLLSHHGFAEVEIVPRTWAAPLLFLVARTGTG